MFSLLDNLPTKVEQLQTQFTVYKFITMYTGTFTFMTTDEEWLNDHVKHPHQNCLAHHQFEQKLFSSGDFAASEKELIYDETENVVFIDGYTLPFYIADGFCKPSTPKRFTLLFGSAITFVQFLFYKVLALVNCEIRNSNSNVTDETYNSKHLETLSRFKLEKYKSKQK